MGKGKTDNLRIPLLRYVDLVRLARRGPVEDGGRHLHWDRQNRRWVAHEETQVNTSPPSHADTGRDRQEA
jgi:hypothetical protein